MATAKKKFKLRDLDIDRVDLVARGANQHAHIVITKSDDSSESSDRDQLLALIEEKRKKKEGRAVGHMSEMVVSKHATHNQKDHGNRDGSGTTRETDSGTIFSPNEFSPPSAHGDMNSRDAGSRKIPGQGSSGEMRNKMDMGGGETTKSGHRPLHSIAREIRRDWGPKVNYAAKPYLEAMSSLEDISDKFYEDSADSVISYFLSNATGWRGEQAKAIKAELKGILNKKPLRKSDEPTRASLAQSRMDAEHDARAQSRIFKNAMLGYPPQNPQQPQNPMMAAANPTAAQTPPPPGPGQPPAPPGAGQAPVPGAPPNPMDPTGMMPPGSMPTPMTDRAGLAEFMRARLAAMPQMPGMPPGMIGAPPPVMPGQPPAQPGMPGAMPGQMPGQPQMPLAPGLPQPGSIPPMMPMMPGQPPATAAPAGAPGVSPSPGAPPPGQEGPPQAPEAPEPAEGEEGGNPFAAKPKSKIPATSGDLAAQLDAAKPGAPGLGMDGAKDKPPSEDDENPEDDEDDEDAKRPPFPPKNNKFPPR